jgi:hypothetical protein
MCHTRDRYLLLLHEWIRVGEHGGRGVTMELEVLWHLKITIESHCNRGGEGEREEVDERIPIPATHIHDFSYINGVYFRVHSPVL